MGAAGWAVYRAFGGGLASRVGRKGIVHLLSVWISGSCAERVVSEALAGRQVQQRNSDRPL